jgi:hypothetical protein
VLREVRLRSLHADIQVNSRAVFFNVTDSPCLSPSVLAKGHLGETREVLMSCKQLIAQIAGTSVTQIERSYFHLRDDARRTVALA